MWVRWIFSVACLVVAGYYAAVLITHSRAPRGSTGGQLRVRPEWGYELSQLAMALGMAAMFSPLGVPVPPLVWLIVFGMAAAWFAACLLHAGQPADDRASGSADSAGHHHLVANLAMLFMVVGGHHHGASGAATGGPQTAAGAGAPVGSGHEGHIAGVGGGWLDGPIGTVLTLVLAGYFAVHTVRSLRVLFNSATQRESTQWESTQPESTQRESTQRERAPRAVSDPGTAGIGPVTVVLARRAATQSRVQVGCHVVMGIAMTVMFGLML